MRRFGKALPGYGKRSPSLGAAGLAVCRFASATIGRTGTGGTEDRFEQENEWKNPDSASDPKAYVRYLDRIFEGMASSGPAVDYKRQVYEMMEIKAGDSIIDIGCGTGADVLAIAEILSTKTTGDDKAGGKVTGVDISETMAREAEDKLSRRRRETNPNISERVEIDFYAGNAQQLSDIIPSNSYDICRCDRSLQHMSSPKEAMEEMVRISKPGVGRIVISEPDWETLVIDSPSHGRVTRKIINHFTDTRVNGWMGRQLFRLYKNAGLVDVTVFPMTYPITDLDFIRAAYLDKAQRIAVKASVVTDEESLDWMTELIDMDSTDQFFSTLTIYCAIGSVR
mmetsp:Transcript_18411/g.40090  ORF Transcript_18411/g.40090 Transcript_18411/m.40090 type:complete len:339 (-) Transcript_18411:202-1218(-)|eukprot:CAMPEP_0168164644 /NCGR_PEP_ID=MMETSP0139_2-20121125/1051_1 /TAXON_ID=44445 /ORGANISM="Pseudo-nitzschia australis, Strain 10249 10 AB" /LENGTH=338 /DNA_ID=CAMNT_0008081683 /DNA_START=128 /DNA_END=1144 /DNA_ORIENTATION=+